MSWLYPSNNLVVSEQCPDHIRVITMLYPNNVLIISEYVIVVSKQYPGRHYNYPDHADDYPDPTQNYPDFYPTRIILSGRGGACPKLVGCIKSVDN